ncbi:MAG: carbon-nitrogen hydrolase family protein [Acidobacteriota bacterium]
MAKLRVAVCELDPEMEPGSKGWKSLSRDVRGGRPDLFLINEMPFGPWISARDAFDPEVWRVSLESHEKGVALLGELGAQVVLGSRARERDGRRVNEAFVWTREGGYEGVHTKQYFPDELGYYEARWFQPGESHFRVVAAGPVRVGFLICTEVMFNEHARHYGRQGAQLIAVPRAVGRASLPRWEVAMKMAAIVSGCYVLSSNRSGLDSKGQRFGGCGWVIDPHGDLVARTSPASPVVFCDLDTDFVAGAQKEYPCYVPELGR